MGDGVDLLDVGIQHHFCLISDWLYFKTINDYALIKIKMSFYQFQMFVFLTSEVCQTADTHKIICLETFHAKFGSELRDKLLSITSRAPMVLVGPKLTQNRIKKPNHLYMYLRHHLLPS